MKGVKRTYSYFRCAPCPLDSFFLWSQTILIRFTGHACGKFGFLAFISTVLESLSLEFAGNTQFYEVF